ncbi:MAG: nucleoside 2-deoxyribosyltransferase domain-containing protein [Patescibacteria group bacterium]
MRVVYVGDKEEEVVGKSIFLAGPTPDIMSHKKSWRGEAIIILEELGFTGSVFIPERRDGTFTGQKLPEDVFKGLWVEQAEWEEDHLKRATCIAFWIPRDLKKLPGFTTNIEWGRWESSGKIVLGAPASADKMRYIRYYAKKLNIPSAFSLRGTMLLATKMADER